ncbi:hypothetical protein [Methylomonas rivi]|uniref:VPLPA-CTERM sorting domain-containing protein n=1 Tax=Methylomonas rivi TaxID=2952226 RepID=A0ABT1UAE7_9GAMM|nr:hypothetical protein [Methylomonas sp. WSC-6]MCQ8130838.1 hypothetical protein [Methylomonas sp. WSC-6]
MQKQWLKHVLVLGMSLNLSVAAAAEQHAGDIQPWKVGNDIYVNASFFEADFGDLPGGLFNTDDPGYDTDTAQGAFGAGNWLRFAGLGTLQFWDGSIWSNTLPNGEHIVIEDVLGEATTFTGAGVTNPVGVIDQLDAAGDLHSHLDFTIFNAGNNPGGSVGAYWITLQIFETAAESLQPIGNASTPFSIFFNRGLSHEAFEFAVESAVSAVPLPSALWLFGSAIVGVMSMVKRRGAALSA